MTSEQMRVIARAVARLRGRARCASRSIRIWCSAGSVRATSGALYQRLAAAGLGLRRGGTVADVTSCPGAETCRLAVTQSRGLGRLHRRSSPRAARSRSPAADGARIKISGCPNGCGQHHIATIGFQGSVRRLGSKAVPQHFVTIGGGADRAGRGLRPPGREDSGAPHPGGGGAPGRAVAKRHGSRRKARASISPGSVARMS